MLKNGSLIVPNIVCCTDIYRKLHEISIKESENWRYLMKWLEEHQRRPPWMSRKQTIVVAVFFSDYNPCWSSVIFIRHCKGVKVQLFSCLLVHKSFLYSMFRNYIYISFPKSSIDLISFCPPTLLCKLRKILTIFIKTMNLKVNILRLYYPGFFHVFCSLTCGILLLLFIPGNRQLLHLHQ